ncbi:peptidylprolyl isomerase [Massilia sp.]|uniref:peptidylprolyl isomerase n=1 Tax=Massilia sp. TaxID=1882437 RepID=UPI00289E5E85|nr:peptidylprolyl isomerase [Massilia sp.]
MPSLQPVRRSLLARLAVAGSVMMLSGAAFAFQDAPAAPAKPMPQVSIKTTMGEIVVELDQEAAPKNVANFLAYVKSGFYKGTIFHRVIDGFMIQAGGMNEKFEGRKTRPAVKNESNNGLSNLPYTVAMAREDNPDSATSQFFINVADNSGIDYPHVGGSGYTVFGRVVKGQEVVDKIKGVVVDDVRNMQNVPVVPITIKSTTLLKGDKLVK